MSSSSSLLPSKLNKKSTNPFKWVRPKSEKDPPKKPLSSYNIYFLLERERIVQGEEERLYTIDDVQNIVKMQKWNHNNRKRQHRKTHGKVSFHDLSRVVANNWRKLSEEHKAVFNQQAAIEKKMYKQSLDAWVMKQMQGQRHISSHVAVAPLPVVPITVKSDAAIKSDNASIKNRSSSLYEVYDVSSTAEDDKMHLSNEEVSYLLGCFNILPLPPDDTRTTTETTGDVTDQRRPNEINEKHFDDYLYDWSVIDSDTPLWYENLTGYSEEFALQMIDANYNSNNQTYLDRAITL